MDTPTLPGRQIECPRCEAFRIECETRGHRIEWLEREILSVYRELADREATIAALNERVSHLQKLANDSRAERTTLVAAE